MSWEPIDETLGLWTAEYRVPLMKARCAAARLDSGGYLVFSPGTGLAEEFRERVGNAEVLLVPNSYHHLGIPSWREAFPEAAVAAHPEGHARLAKQGRTDLQTLDAVAGALPEHLEILEVPSTKIGEIWLKVRSDSGLTWLVGDAFFNMPLARRFRTRLFQKLVKSAPGLSLSQIMKYAGLRDRTAFKQWVLARLEEDAPRRLVPLHGAVLEADDLPHQLRALLDRRL
jgi:hypothetical protein